MKKIGDEMIQQTNEITHCGNLIQGQSTEIKMLKDSVKSTDVRLKQTEAVCKKLSDSVNVLQRSSSSESVTAKEFPLQSTVVAQNVWCADSEDIMKVTTTIINKALDLQPENIQVVRAVRKSSWETGSGLIKIELRSNEEVKVVLKKKSELCKSAVQEI